MQLAAAAPLKELQGLSEKDLECGVCLEPAENAVCCVKCDNILCESHLSKLSKCPYCNSTPFKTQSNKCVRRFISKLEVPCSECGAPIPRGDLSNHQKQFCPKRKEAESSGTKDLQNVTSPASTDSKSITIGTQQVEAIEVTRGNSESSQIEYVIKSKNTRLEKPKQNAQRRFCKIKMCTNKRI